MQFGKIGTDESWFENRIRELTRNQNTDNCVCLWILICIYRRSHIPVICWSRNKSKKTWTFETHNTNAHSSYIIQTEYWSVRFKNSNFFPAWLELARAHAFASFWRHLLEAIWSFSNWNFLPLIFWFWKNHSCLMCLSFVWISKF